MENTGETGILKVLSLLQVSYFSRMPWIPPEYTKSFGGALIDKKLHIPLNAAEVARNQHEQLQAGEADVSAVAVASLEVGDPYWTMMRKYVSHAPMICKKRLYIYILNWRR